jgi:hypothetical protein
MIARTRILAVIATAAAAIGVSAIYGSPAFASSPITTFTASTTTTQAGGHPDITFDVVFKNRQEQPPTPCACSDAKNISIDLPTGLVGNPHATPQCDQVDFSLNRCPLESEIGVSNFGFQPTPIYNLIPHPGQAGLTGFNIAAINAPAYTVLSSRTGSDYGLTASVEGIFHLIPIHNINQTLWGVPAAPSNDPVRLGPVGCVSTLGSPECEGGFSSNAEVLPFIENPTTCGEPLTASLEILSYDDGISTAQADYPATTGCDQLSFNPSLFVQPTTQQADSASGSDVDLKVPQETSPSVPSPSEIRNLIVTLPPGFTLTPNASDGKTSCSDAAAKFHTEQAAQCPEFAKIGTVSVDTPLLPGPLPGYLYIGDPKPGERYRFIIVADGFDVHVKLEGLAIPDPQTGQLTLSFTNLPQFPFEDFNMHFFGSERGILATPTQCGTYPVNATFTPWDEALPEQHSTQFFVLNSGPNGQACPGEHRPFAPSFEAGVEDATAGAHSTFTLNLARSDGDQNLSGLTVATPPGFSATLAGIPYCPDSALAAAADPSYSGIAEQLSSSCPAASQIGTSDTGTGAGTHPVYFPGKVYLAGPYKGAPLSLAAITPGISGPYDLGSVVVRAALNVDRTDAHVIAVSDPLPQIVQGIPLRLRSIQISLNRPGFALNPTNCDPFAVNATINGDQGRAASLGTHFQAASCTSLPYGPKLTLKLLGGVKRLGHPAIHATFQAQPGEANTRVVSVALPKGELLDNAHLDTVCSKVDFAKEACPAGSAIGHVEVSTPVLDQPLKGLAYLRSSQQGLPDLVLDLRGQVDFEASAQIDSVNEGLRATFRTVPDVPVSSIVLDLAGGKKGLLQNSESLCGAHKKATVKMVGQNGTTRNTKVKLQAACGSKARHKRHLSHARRVG